MEQDPQKKSRKGIGGRPKGGKLDRNWNELDDLLVKGEEGFDPESNSFTHRYPTYAELAKRFEISKARVGQYAVEHNCMQRRHDREVQLAAERLGLSERSGQLNPQHQASGQQSNGLGSMAAWQHGSMQQSEHERERSEREHAGDPSSEARGGAAEAEGRGLGDQEPAEQVAAVEDEEEGWDLEDVFGSDVPDGSRGGATAPAVPATPAREPDGWRKLKPGETIESVVKQKLEEPEDPFDAIAGDSERVTPPGNVATAIVKHAQNKSTRGADGRGAIIPKAIWDKVDELLVFGIKEGSSYRYPAAKEIAEMCGISDASVSLWRKQNLCDKRRAEIEAKRYKTLPELARQLDKQLDELDGGSGDTDRTALQVKRVAQKYLDRFERALDENRVNATNIVDLDRIVRLLKFVQGEADSRKEVKQVVSVQALTERYQLARQVEVEVSPIMAGVIPDDEEDAEVVE